MKDSFSRCLITALLTALICAMLFSAAFYISLKVLRSWTGGEETRETKNETTETPEAADVYDPIDSDELRPIRSMIRFIETGEAKYFLEAVDPEQRIGLSASLDPSAVDMIMKKAAGLFRDKTLSIITSERLIGIDYELIDSKDAQSPGNVEKVLEIRVSIRTNKETHVFILNPCVRSVNGKWYLKIPDLNDLLSLKQEA
ncbi:MAG: hypothetical protein J5854_02030 [Clostridia bacterium]|nr:hypothetical protein [Clostridia bacterium]